MYLDAPTKKLAARLLAPPAAPVSVVSCFDDVDAASGDIIAYRQQSNPVLLGYPGVATIVPAPAAGSYRLVKSVRPVNASNTALTAELVLLDGSSVYPAGKLTLGPGVMVADSSRGFSSMSACGQRRRKMALGECGLCAGPTPVSWTLVLTGMPEDSGFVGCPDPFATLNGTHILTPGQIGPHFCSWVVHIPGWCPPLPVTIGFALCNYPPHGCLYGMALDMQRQGSGIVLLWRPTLDGVCGPIILNFDDADVDTDPEWSDVQAVLTPNF